MKKPQLLTIVTILSALLFSGTEVLAQEEVPRYEVGWWVWWGGGRCLPALLCLSAYAIPASCWNKAQPAI